MAPEQLALPETSDHPWQLDDHTREIGRRGLQLARSALRRALPESPAPDAERAA